MCRTASPDAWPLERTESIDFSRAVGRQLPPAGPLALESSRRSSLARCFDDAERCAPVVRPAHPSNLATMMGSTPDTSAVSRGGAATHSCPRRELAVPPRREVKRAQTLYAT
jgi:hypothetical protein